MKTIGAVAKYLNINTETIRFYQREGLIQQPQKPTSGYRQYSPSDINRLQFILNAKSLGFTLKEIKSLLTLSQNCDDIESLSRAKLAVIQHKIQQLKKLESVIQELTRSCQSNTDKTRCPIIESLTNP
jgi:MerR family mercuric resistance operon transcriptional regulator